ncbi:type II toxin-antitoxin system HicB family antitoxin [Leisingera caerulea]|uniref:type II toxin-antitoxin system HicB family antitoxin n=1 Tax=Leisingera caerulea TaxID=506591 RepID=UPI00041A5AD1|nr:type II toxin-antitoxin system HicB family antitoxin [Leisingera caerulea]
MFYPIDLTPDDNDTFLVTCPDLPEVTSFGASEEEAIANGRNAILEAIAARMDAFQEIPPPSAGGGASIPLTLSIKLQLYWALNAAGMTRADLQRATGWSRTKVDRLFDPNHESKLTQVEEAFEALGMHVEITAEAA